MTNYDAYPAPLESAEREAKRDKRWIDAVMSA